MTENMNNTIITGKYKTIGELKKQSKKSIIQVITRMKDSDIKKYLCKWAFEKYYLPNKYKGNLTNRIKKINKLCYNHIVYHCFDNIDPLNIYQKNIILNNDCTNIIEILHNINSSTTGIFIDYLIRRIICELKQNEFTDIRANEYTNLNDIDYKNKKNIWQFRNLENDGIGYWIITKEPKLGSTTIDKLEDGDRFLELKKKK